MVFMELKEFMDISKLQKIQDKFSDATGLAAIAVGNDGQYLTEGSNFTEFCMKYTRGSKETAAVSSVTTKAVELTSAMRDLWTSQSILK